MLKLCIGTGIILISGVMSLLSASVWFRKYFLIEFDLCGMMRFGILALFLVVVDLVCSCKKERPVGYMTGG